ncbi:unnamed protein product [Camellia sinensis]
MSKNGRNVVPKEAILLLRPLCRRFEQISGGGSAVVAENEDEGGGGDVMGSGDQRSEEASTVVRDRRLEAMREIGLQINHEENADLCFFLFCCSSLEVQYLHDYAGISIRIGLTANSIVNFSGVLGSNVVALGTDVSFDTKTGEFTKCNAGLSFSNADLIASLTL